jgi:L-threonylcarbamoyladenylate synthase
VRTLHVSDEEALPAAASALRAGEVIVVPTDTVYGLAALPDDGGAVDRVYLAKERPQSSASSSPKRRRPWPTDGGPVP